MPGLKLCIRLYMLQLSIVKAIVSCGMVPCSMVGCYQCFGGIYFLSLYTLKMEATDSSETLNNHLSDCSTSHPRKL
jgi:hypothetical protein